MKLLFLGLTPSRVFQSTVISHGFSCVVSKTIPTMNRSRKFEMIVCAVDRKSDLKKLKIIDKRFPQSWVSVVIEKKRLDEPEFYSALIENEFKNTVWLSDTWESLFWFSYQQMLESRNNASKVKILEKEVFQFRVKTMALSEASNKLLDKFNRDVDLVENIQRVLRPRFSPHIPGINLSVKYIPASGGGGDYYDIFEFGDKKRFGILLADSKSHGMAAALLTVLLKLRLEEMKDRFPDSKSFITFLNQEIKTVHDKIGSSISLFYGILDRASLTFQYTAAGSLKPIWWRGGRSKLVPSSQNPEVGGRDHFEFRENTLQLQPGDLMILYTNGVEAPLKKKKMLCEERILELLKKREPSPEPLDVQNELMGVIDEYTAKKKLKDDLTLIHLAVDERAMYVAKAEGD